MTRISERLLLLVLVAAAIAGSLAGTPARAAVQSDALSRQSAASLDASVEVPVAAANALSQGAKFSVTGVQASAQGVALTISAAGAGASFVVKLSAQQAKALGVLVGSTVLVSVVVGGWLLSDTAGKFICFVPNDRARELIHSQRVTG
ncbi:hypothetical protein [Pseudomonas sp. CGJS7]|uniref:hypothetical protein n=1 Tax=Pseudomonas sp. CGJS7 TaxID=3109348 RepID=UPI0030094B5A